MRKDEEDGNKDEAALPTFSNRQDQYTFRSPVTNAYYTGRAHGALLRFGRSKQKRNDCPLVTLALLLDESGFPRSCEMLPGNVSEPATLEDALRRLELRCNDKKPTVIMDAGIASEENM